MKINEEKFCGDANILPKTIAFQPKSKPWDSASLIGHLKRSDILQNDTNIEDLRKLFWKDLCSEYDAENFCKYLENSHINLSDDFKSFEFVWRRDEFNHYLGFRHIYSICFGVSKEEISNKVIKRSVDFEPILGLLEDEFKICLLLAYDEIATTKAYSTDFDKYKTLGHKNFLTWIKRVTRDESYHFHNCMQLIGKNHRNRISELPRLVDKFIEWDLGENAYKGTFVLDHDSEYFSKSFLIDCGNVIKNYFA